MAMLGAGRCRSRLQDLNNVLGALYLVMVFLGIINATSVQPVAHQERSVMAPLRNEQLRQSEAAEIHSLSE